MGVYKRGKVKIPIYGGVLHIHICDTFDPVKKHLKIDHENIGCFDACYFKVDEEDLDYHVWIGLNKPGVIAHEAKHVVNAIFVDICAELDPRNDEPECYLLEWVVEKIHDVIDRDK